MYLLRYLIFTFLSGITICLLSCKNKPDGIIEREKMTKVMLHMMMVDEYMSYYLINDSLEQKRDSIRAQKYLDVLSLHKTDSASFSKSMAYYKKDIKEFSVLVDSLNTLAIREREKRFQMNTAENIDSLPPVADSLLQ